MTLGCQALIYDFPVPELHERNFLGEGRVNIGRVW